MRSKFGIKWSGTEGLFPEIEECFTPSNLKQLLRNKIIQKRLFVTIILLVLYYLCDLVLIPTVDHSLIRESLSIFAQSEEVPRHLMSSPRLSILALGLIPYITACLFLQLLSFIVPSLYSLYHHGESRIGLINWYTLALAIALSVTWTYPVCWAT